MEIKPQNNSENCKEYPISLKKRKRNAKPHLPKHAQIELIQTLSMAIKTHLNPKANIRNAAKREKCVVTNEVSDVMSTNECNGMPVEFRSTFNNLNANANINHEEHSDIHICREQPIRDVVLYEKTFHDKQNYFCYCNTERNQSTFERTVPNKILLILSLEKVLNQNIMNGKEIQRFMENEPQKITSLIPSQVITTKSDPNVDITSLLEMVAISLNSFYYLLYKLNERLLKAKRHEVDKVIVIKFDIKYLVRYLTLQYSQNKMIKQAPPKSRVSCTNNITALPSACKSLDICIQRRCMNYRISICKFNSFSQRFLETLAILYNSGILSLETNAIKQVPSVFKRGWHVRDLTQGYMLAFLLRNCNVVSLNVMRRLYFVIITSVTPNLTLKLNFNLGQGIFITYDSNIFEGCSLNIRQWKVHGKDSTKTADSNKAICEVKRKNCISNHDIDLKMSKSNYSYYDSSTTLKNESVIDCDESEDLENSIFYSELESIDVKPSDSSTEMDIKDSVLTLTLSIDEMSSAHDLFDVRKACGDTNLADIIQMYNFKCNKSKSTVETSKMWLKRIYNESIAMTSNLDISRLAREHVINESIFNGFDECSHTLLQYWMQLKSDVHIKLFCKQLGQTVFHTLFSSVIPT